MVLESRGGGLVAAVRVSDGDMGPCPVGCCRGGLEISSLSGQSCRPSVLVIEPDETTARRVVAAMGRRYGSGPPRRRAADRQAPELEPAQCQVVASLRELFEQDLDGVELVICSAHLP